MQDTDARGTSPAFLRPQNGSSHRSSGYIPGRIAPLRPPLPSQSHAAAEFTSARQEARTRLPSLTVDQHRRQAEANRHKNTLICFAFSSLSLFVALGIFLGIASKYAPDENCPDQNPRLKNWSPGKDPEKRVFIKKGDLFRLNSDATVHSIVIQDGGLLVFGDDKEGSKNITLRTRFILIKDGGMLHVGAEKCHYKSKATIILYGKSNEGADVPEFGKKFIGVGPEGTLELHGHQKLSWTLLSKTMYFSGLAYGHYTFKKNFSRGLNVRLIDQDTAEILEVLKFDTHEFSEESLKLQNLLKNGSPGRIVAIAVGDSAAKNLLEETRLTIQNLLGSKFVRGLSYRQAWAFVGVIGGGNSSCNESVRNYENHSTGGKALAQKEFFTVDGQKFVVRAYSEWNDGVPISGFQVEAVGGVILNLLDDVSSWEPGDRIVVASTDYSMYQTEEFTLLPCPECTKHQGKKDVSQIFNNILRRQIGTRSPTVEYISAHPHILFMLLKGYESPNIALRCGIMLRECIRHEPLAKIILFSEQFRDFFKYVEMSTFDIASDAFATFKDLLTRHKLLVAEFLEQNYDAIFEDYEKLLHSENYVTKRQSLKLLGELILDRHNFAIMTKYISKPENLKLMMNLLRDKSPNIQFEAFHVFKVFVASPNKTQPIVEILLKNQPKLIEFLSNFQKERTDDEQFTDEKNYLIKQIRDLKKPTA